jgi:uncharacterized protein (TIGR00255 family)
MLISMTGFGSAQATVASIGRISVEIRSVNHKFLEIVSHLPAGFLSLEDKIKKDIEAKLKRGRVICAVNITEQQANKVFINQRLVKDYVAALKKTQHWLKIGDGLTLETLIHLPGVVSLIENNIAGARLWPRIKPLLDEALRELRNTRIKEGRALAVYLKNRSRFLKANLEAVKKRSQKVIRQKAAVITSDEERSSFLKEADITEEIERLQFHIDNFIHKLNYHGPAGKELDFIAQEMQREANTMGAKSCDAFVSGKAICLKSEIEKIREQVQNIE